jgi:tellurite resistance protein
MSRLRLLFVVVAACCLWGLAQAQSPRAPAFKPWTEKAVEKKPKSSGTESPHQNPDVLFAILAGMAITLWILLALKNRIDLPRVRNALHDDPRRQRPAERQAALARLRERDPSFDEQQFLAGAQKAFREIRGALSRADAWSASRLMSDGLMRRFVTKLQLDAAQGRREVEAELLLVSAAVVAAESDAAYDTLHVDFDVLSRPLLTDQRVSADEAILRAARSAKTPVDEVWTFVRRLDPGTCQGRLSEGKCPACGAPVERSAVATCGFCKAILNSGAHDWVLCQVTSSGDFFCRTHASVRSFALLQARDPLVNRPVLEDRASLVFWKWIEAQATSSPRRFARLCTEEAYARLAACATEPPRGFERVELGEVRLVQVDCEPDRERAHFILYWCTAAEDWEHPRKSMLTLERRAGVKTRAETGLATDRCHHCAAFQKELDAVDCEYCGARLPNDWAFVDALPLDEFYLTRHATSQNAALLADQIGDAQSPHEARRLLAAIMAMVKADGVVRESERKLVERCARRWSVPADRLAALWKAPAEELSLIRPRNDEEAQRILRGLIAAAYSDGGIGAQERRLLSQVAGRLRLPPGALKAALDEIAQALAEAKQEAQG